MGTGKGGGSTNSDGGVGPFRSAGGTGDGWSPFSWGSGAGSGSSGSRGGRKGSPNGTKKRSLLYGPGVWGNGIIDAPEILLDLADGLRDATEFMRDKFAWIVDNTLGEMGIGGEFIGGFLKRGFDYALMGTIFGYGVWEEELSGLTGGFALVTDAMLNPHPASYERLGKMIRMMPDHFAHMSAGEWGSLAFDVAPALVSGGASLTRVAGRIGSRLSKMVVSRLQGSVLRTYGDALRKALGPARVSHPAEYERILSHTKALGVEVQFRRGIMVYEPALSSGAPGRLKIDPDLSIGALRHEYRHVVELHDRGFPSFRIMEDPVDFWGFEFRGYMEEIRLSRQIRDYDAGAQIVQEMRLRRQEILNH